MLGPIENTVKNCQEGNHRSARPSEGGENRHVNTHYLERIGLKGIRVKIAGSQVDSRRAVNVPKSW